MQVRLGLDGDDLADLRRVEAEVRAAPAPSSRTRPLSPLSSSRRCSRTSAGSLRLITAHSRANSGWRTLGACAVIRRDRTPHLEARAAAKVPVCAAAVKTPTARPEPKGKESSRPGCPTDPRGQLHSAQRARWSPRAVSPARCSGSRASRAPRQRWPRRCCSRRPWGRRLRPPSTNCTLITHATLAGGTSATARQRLQLILPRRDRPRTGRLRKRRESSLTTARNESTFVEELTCG